MYRLHHAQLACTVDEFLCTSASGDFQGAGGGVRKVPGLAWV